MGYYSRISGEISVHPPLRWSEVKDTPFISQSRSRLLRIRIEEETQPVDDGEIITRRGVCIEDDIGDSAKYYNLEAELSEIAETYPDHRFDGYIVRVGESNGDIERYSIHKGRVQTEQAIVTWPDGTPVAEAGK